MLSPVRRGTTILLLPDIKLTSPTPKRFVDASYALALTGPSISSTAAWFGAIDHGHISLPVVVFLHR
jgi:hypothetical protein